MSDLKGIEYKRFEDIKHIREDGSEYWSARELGSALDYAKWENFAKVIKRAIYSEKRYICEYETVFIYNYGAFSVFGLLAGAGQNSFGGLI